VRWRLGASLLTAAIGGALIAGSLASGADGKNGKTFEYSVGLWGDFPYNDAQATTGVPNLIADMNSSDIEFSVHDGDLKAGNGTPGSTTPTLCDNALYAQALRYLDTFVKPAMFTPGDNDWTDCDRPANCGFNSLERLDYERALYFTSPNSFGSHPMPLEVQSTPLCPGFSGPARCVENRRWTYKGVTYFTMNVQGSCNNLCDTDPDPVEWAGRNAANIEWMHQSFRAARDANHPRSWSSPRRTPASTRRTGREHRSAIRRRWRRRTKIRTAFRSTWSLYAMRRSAFAGPCFTSMATHTTSAWTSRSRTRKASA